MRKQSQIWLIASTALLALLAGCGTPTPRQTLDVGQVVVAPQAKLPPPPVVVQKTSPKPQGYFQQSLLDYFSGSSSKPTRSTPLTPAAGPTPTQ